MKHEITLKLSKKDKELLDMLCQQFQESPEKIISKALKELNKTC